MNFEHIDVQSVNQSVTQNNGSSEKSEFLRSIRVENGAPGEIRTRDLLITSQPL